MHPSTRSSQSPTQLQVEAELDSPVPYNPPAAILDAVNVTADSAAKQSPTLDGAQFSQFFAILKHKVPDIVHSLLLPGMLFTFSETWLSLIRRVRQPFSNPTVPIPSRSTPVDQNFTVAQSLISILVEIPSRCDRARYAGIGTLCGAMVVFTLVLQVVVRLLMVYIVIVCLATIYILSIVEDLAQSLLHSGFPYAWSDDDDELVANVLALPKPFPMLCTIVAGSSAIIAMMSGVSYSPEEIFCLLRGDLSETQQSDQSTTSSEPPQPWLYGVVACMVVAEICQCVLVRSRLRKLLRDMYDCDREHCPQSALLQTTGLVLARSSPSETPYAAS